MARIRSIKPEFWTDESVMECSTTARLMFIGMWNFADDKGRLENSLRQIKAKIFPGDDLDLETIRRMLDELSSNELVLIYSVDNKEYIQIKGWRHQKIDRPQPAKYPDPPDNPNPIRRTFDDHSSGDRIGRDRIGEEKKDNAADAATSEYAFTGKVVRLTKRDYENWSAAYTNIHLTAELTAYDDWLSTQPEQEKKNWFFRLSGHLKNQNKKAPRSASVPDAIRVFVEQAGGHFTKTKAGNYRVAGITYSPDGEVVGA